MRAKTATRYLVAVIVQPVLCFQYFSVAIVFSCSTWFGLSVQYRRELSILDLSESFIVFLNILVFLTILGAEGHPAAPPSLAKASNGQYLSILM